MTRPPHWPAAWHDKLWGSTHCGDFETPWDPDGDWTLTEADLLAAWHALEDPIWWAENLLRVLHVSSMHHKKAAFVMRKLNEAGLAYYTRPPKNLQKELGAGKRWLQTLPPATT
jgi:hypothetical protein